VNCFAVHLPGAMPEASSPSNARLTTGSDSTPRFRAASLVTYLAIALRKARWWPRFIGQSPDGSVSGMIASPAASSGMRTRLFTPRYGPRFCGPTTSSWCSAGGPAITSLPQSVKVSPNSCARSRYGLRLSATPSNIMPCAYATHLPANAATPQQHDGFCSE